MLYAEEFTCSPNADIQKKLQEATTSIPTENIISVIQRSSSSPNLADHSKGAGAPEEWVIIHKGGRIVDGGTI